MYLDKHNTEIRLGDTLAENCGEPIKVISLGKNIACERGIFVEATGSEYVVLSRADGTPVYRYRDGQDVRAGDIYTCTSDKEYTVSGNFLKGTKRRNEGTAAGCAGCTLIRRAGESEKPHTCTCGRRSMLCNAAGQCPDCQKRQLSDAERDYRATCHECGFAIPLGSTTVQTSVVTVHGTTLCNDCAAKHAKYPLQSEVLGLDRNGREVRKGATLKTVSGTFVADSWEFGRFVSTDRARVVAAQYCELVTDEKAARVIGVHSFREGDRVRMVGGMFAGATGVVARDIGDTHCVPVKLDHEDFYPRRMPPENVELVTDEKAEPRGPDRNGHDYRESTICYLCGCSVRSIAADGPCDRTLGPGCVRCGGNDATGHRSDCLAVSGAPAWYNEVESLLRALARPTMGERFRDFKARMLPAISGSQFVEYCFDCSIKNGPTLLARCTKIPVEGDYLGGWEVAWNEQARVESVCSQMDWWALVLGRAILRGGK